MTTAFYVFVKYILMHLQISGIITYALHNQHMMLAIVLEGHGIYYLIRIS